MAQKEKNIELNQQFHAAYDHLENSKNNIFITGRAGTGKSTLLRYFRGHTSKNVVVLAPTGVAAVNVGGQTIHSFFRFKPDITPEGVDAIRVRRESRKIYRAADMIMIDEVSMVRADLLDCMDRFLRKHGRNKKLPFGGVQMVFIGDLFQLPPVVPRDEQSVFQELYSSPYFFSAKVCSEIEMDIVDLATIYRQQDDVFISLLNAIREKTITQEQLVLLNKRYQPDFLPCAQDLYVYLTTTNALAQRVNSDHLRSLPGRTYHYQGTVDGSFSEKTLPTQQCLDLKLGAQVMLLNNDHLARWVNGSIGKVTAVAEDLKGTDVIGVELENGRLIEVVPFTWEMFRFYYNEDTQALDSKSVGAFRQYPLRLAWAVTIHKSQGKTFSKVVVDIGQGTFAHGQAYVALSRCSSLEGIVLRRPIQQHHIMVDERIVDFLQNFS